MAGKSYISDKSVKKQCTAEQLVMISEYLNGATKTAAFQAAFPERAVKAKRLGEMARKEFTFPCVVDEIKRRQAARDKAIEQRAETEAARMLDMWPREEHLRRLIEIAEAARKRRGDGVKMDKDGIAAGRLERDTLDSIGKLLGYDAPVKVEADNNITVRFAGAADGNDWTV